MVRSKFVCILVAGGMLPLLSTMSAAAQGQPAKFAVHSIFTAPSEGAPGELYVFALVEDGMHVFSIAQPKGGPKATKIKITAPPGVKVGDFEPLLPPKTHIEPIFNNLEVQEHAGAVAWRAPLELDTDATLDGTTIAGSLQAQACNETACFPPKTVPFTSHRAQRGAWPSTSEGDNELGIRIAERLADESPADSIVLAVEMTPESGFAIRFLDAPRNDDDIQLVQSVELLERREFADANNGDEKLFTIQSQPESSPKLVWTRSLSMRGGAKQGQHLILGRIEISSSADARRKVQGAVRFATLVPIDNDNVVALKWYFWHEPEDPPARSR